MLAMTVFLNWKELHVPKGYASRYSIPMVKSKTLDACVTKNASQANGLFGARLDPFHEESALRKRVALSMIPLRSAKRNTPTLLFLRNYRGRRIKKSTSRINSRYFSKNRATTSKRKPRVACQTAKTEKLRLTCDTLIYFVFVCWIVFRS
jgi:hypothetical protein